MLQHGVERNTHPQNLIYEMTMQIIVLLQLGYTNNLFTFTICLQADAHQMHWPRWQAKNAETVGF